MAEKKYYWLKLHEDFFKSREIKKLRRIAGGDTFTIIYLKMQLLSINNGGVIVYDNIETGLVEQLSLDLDEALEDIKLTLAFLQANKLIEQFSEEEYFLNKVPETIGSETEWAEKKREYRARKKELLQGQCDGQKKTLSDKSKDIDKDIDIDKDKDKTKTKKTSVIDTMINEYTDNEQLKESLYNFIDMRKQIKKPATDKAVKLLLGKLNKLTSDDSLKIEMLNESVINSWQSVFIPKLNYKNSFLTKPEKSKQTLYEWATKDEIPFGDLEVIDE